MVYFMQAGERIKIGYAQNVKAVRQRLNTISSASPVQVDLLGAIEGTVEDERAWHARFSDARLHSEWFAVSGELLDAIAGCSHVAIPARGTARLSFRCHRDLVVDVDVARGPMPRERWLRRAVERALESAAHAQAIEEAGGIEAVYAGRGRVPVAIPTGGARASHTAKRDVKPIPKKEK